MPIEVAFLSPDEYAGLVARLDLLTSRLSQLESRMQISDQQAADLTREIDETKAALAALATAFLNVKDSLAAAQAEIAALGQPSQAVSDAIAALDAEQAKVAALLAAPAAGGGDGPIVA